MKAKTLSWRVYLILGAVFGLSFLLVLHFDQSVTLQLIGGIPGVLSLIGVLFQLVRDDAEHQRALLRQRDQQLFDLGATSHMANVAFDKHVLFCEEYASEMYATVTTLFRDGPSPLALSHSGNLYRLRQKHAVWLTPHIDSQLTPFEMALTRIGGSAHLQNVSPSTLTQARFDEMYDVFSDVLGLAKDEGKAIDQTVAVATIMQRLRSVLGIEALTTMRGSLLNAPPGA